MSSEGEGTVYDRIEKLKDEIATLRNEIDVIKNAFRNELARHEIKMIKKGHDVSSILINLFSNFPKLFQKQNPHLSALGSIF
jgi:hypothetical protein